MKASSESGLWPSWMRRVAGVFVGVVMRLSRFYQERRWVLFPTDCNAEARDNTMTLLTPNAVAPNELDTWSKTRACRSSRPVP